LNGGDSESGLPRWVWWVIAVAIVVLVVRFAG